MIRKNAVKSMCMAVAGLVLLPALAAAQSALAGLVTDTSGAVLPGVTVEAASPALIEKVRTVVTDTQGRYTVVDLRPGVYRVTFMLPGFNTAVRDGVELPSNFTATVNAELRVGAVEETITVSGQAPVVDVHSTQRTEVLSKDVVDMLPVGRVYRSVGILLPGVGASGGNRPVVGDISIPPTLSTQGGTSWESITEIDGVPMPTLHGSTYQPYNEAMIQESTFQSSALTADVSRGGVRVNLIGQDGGNTFTGGGTFNFSDGAWQANNLTTELIARNLRAQNSLAHSFDLNPWISGPLKRDKLWLFGSSRYQEHNQFVARTEGKDGRLMATGGHITNHTARLTWQVASKHQVKIHADYIGRPLYSFGPGTAFEAIAPRPDSLYNLASAKWASPMTNRLLLEAGSSWTLMGFTKRYQPGVEEPRGTPAWYAKAPRRDLSLGTSSVASTGGSAGRGVFFPVMNMFVASMSYVTGTHNFKTGVQLGRGYILDSATYNADLVQIYLNGVPTFVDVLNSPWERRERINADLGIYAQDSWTIRRLTVNAGVRFEHFNASIDAQSAPAGRFMPARSFPAVPNLPNFNDVVPRLGISYDLFGHGRTAIKASVNKYVAGYALGNPGGTSSYNPMSAQGFAISETVADRRDWTDRDRLGRDLPTNGDNIAQDNEIGPSNNLNYGLKPTRRLDPSFSRPSSIEYTASVQHEVRPGLSVSAFYMWRPYRKLLTSQNQFVSLSDYTAFQVASPLNGEPITVYNLNRAKQGQVDLLDRNSEINERTYTGFHLLVSARLPGGGSLIGGWSTERTRSVTCDTNNPNQFRFCDQSGKLHQDAGATANAPFTSSYKLIGAFPGLPFRFTGGVSMRSYREGVLDVNWVVPASVFPGGQRTQPVTVPLIAPNTKFLPRWTQLDLSVKRTFRIGGTTLVADLTVFNVINSSVVLAELQTFGPSLGTPTEIMSGRVPRIGLQMRF